jgi:hypothetical protein
MLVLTFALMAIVHTTVGRAAERVVVSSRLSF